MTIEYRYLYEKIENHLENKQYAIIIGARQVGKTSLLKKLYFKLKNNNEIVELINLENKSTVQKLDKDPLAIFDHIQVNPKKSLEGKAEKRIYLLIDEIQYLEDPSNFMKLIYDEYEENVKLIVTGSSAFYIDTKFKDSLAGRKRLFRLYPLTFNEFLRFKKQEKVSTELISIVSEPSYASQYGKTTENLLMEYLTFGGYPAVVLEDDHEEKKWILDELQNSYLRRDILESGIDKEIKFLQMIKLLAGQIGNVLNKSEISNTLGIDSKTVAYYLHILEKSFHISLLRPFHYNLRKEIIKMPKIYFNDIGLRNSILGRLDPIKTRDDKGEVWENFVFNQYRIKYYPHKYMRYWRTSDGKEIDLVIEESYQKGFAVEVKWNCNRFSKKKYKKFETTYPDFPIKCIDINNKEILLD